MTQGRIPKGQARIVPQNIILSPVSPNFSTSEYLKLNNGGTTALAAWFGANKPCAIPFVVNTPFTIMQLGWFNGSALTDNFDCGVYDVGFNRLISTGSTARVGATLNQWVDVTDTVLGPGKYWLAGASNGTTANCARGIGAAKTVAVMAQIGMQDSATNSFPLPNPLVGMAAAATMTTVPIMYIAGRALV